MRGEQQSRLAVLRVLDEGLRGRLAAAIVDRLGLEADVHREQLARGMEASGTFTLRALLSAITPAAPVPLSSASPSTSKSSSPHSGPGESADVAAPGRHEC